MPVSCVKVASGGLAVSQAPTGFGTPFVIGNTGIAVTVVPSGGLGIADAGGSGGGIFTSPANTAWSTTDKSSVNLSGGNLTATGTAAGGVRSNNGLVSGKYYFEQKLTVIGTNSMGVGVATSSATLATVTTAYAGAAAMNRLGAVFINGTNSGTSLGTRAVNDVIGIAVDLGGKLIWFRVAPAGNWNNSGTADPAAGAGGLGISALTGTLFVLFGSGGNTDAVTANFGTGAFSGAVPSGYTSGWPT